MFPFPRVTQGEAAPDGAGRAARRMRAGLYDPSRKHFTLYFLIPITLIVASAMVALLGGMLWFAHAQNAAADLAERERVKAAFLAEVEAVERTNKGWAVWDEAARRLVATFDPAWADSNEGGYVFDHEGIEATFVVDRSGRTLYGHVNGARSPAEPAQILGPGYAAAMRGILAAPPRNATRGGVSVSRFGTTMFGITRIRSHGPVVATPPGVHRYLVMAKLVDEGVLAGLSRAANGRRIMFGTGPRPGLIDWTFVSFDGGSVRSFLWPASAPGTALLLRAAPWLVLLILVMGGLASFVLRRARKAARELVASEARALYLASRDPLTGLANRRSFGAHLLDLKRRREAHSLLFLDLDGFKKVNDTFGHGVGDKLLCRTAARLQRVLSADAFLARLGGDEFAVTVPRPDSVEALDALAAGMVDAVSEPHHFGGEPTTVGVSIGIAINREGDYDELVRHADTAMYVAKQDGRNRWQHYCRTLDEGRETRRRLELDLKQALANREIFVMFQPIVDAQSGRVVTVEALARWTHPTMGPISPDMFIPIAEESGLIVELGRQILEQACGAARGWPFRLAVNLSPAQFWEGDLVEQVVATLKRCDFPPTRLKFEITETYLLSRPDAADRVIKELRHHGIRIALDDFGTGYASIGYLRRFQFDLVKIDRSLVEAVVFDPTAADVLMAIVSLCQALGLPILAEGVETAEQATMLRNNGCKYLQGYYFGRPVGARDIDALVAARLRDVA